MSSSKEFADFVCFQLEACGEVRCRKMFGEYMVYVNSKPLVMVCDNTAFVKMLPQLSELMAFAERGYPYPGAREHYVLDVEDRERCREVLAILDENIHIPNKRK